MHSLLFICLLSFSVVASQPVEVPNDHATVTTHPTAGEKDLAIGKMTAMGYDPSVAKRIAAARPDLVKRIIENKADMRPIRLYRGLTIDPSAFEPLWENASSRMESSFRRHKEMWVAKAPKTALAFAITDPSKSEYLRTVIEYEIPRCFYRTGYGSGFPDPHEREAKDQSAGVLLPKFIPDSRPFIREMGIVDTRQIRFGRGELRALSETELDTQWERATTWYPYDQVFAQGRYVGPTARPALGNAERAPEVIRPAQSSQPPSK